MDDDETIKWVAVGVLAWLVYSRTRNAVKRITDFVERAKNLGLTDAEVESAHAVILDPKASIADKRQAAGVLRVKVNTAKDMGPIAVAHLKPLETALNLYERELAGQDELAEKRKAWEAARAAAGKTN